MASRLPKTQTTLLAAAGTIVIVATGSAAAVMHYAAPHTHATNPQGALTQIASAQLSHKSAQGGTGTSTQAVSDATATHPNGSQKPKLPAYDPRNTGPLQPTPDKPAIPNARKPLTISPSSITLYKNMDGAGNVKPGINEMTIQVSNVDGKSMYYPSADMSGGVTVTSSTFTTRAVWDMTAAPEYAAPGTVDVPIMAVSGDDTVAYVGKLHVTVLPMPSFYVSTDQTYATGSPDSTDFDCGDTPAITYSSSFDQAYAPTISVEDPDGQYSFTSLGFADYGFHFRSSSPISWGKTIQLRILVENKFQLYTIPCTLQTGQ